MIDAVLSKEQILATSFADLIMQGLIMPVSTSLAVSHVTYALRVPKLQSLLGPKRGAGNGSGLIIVYEKKEQRGWESFQQDSPL